MSDRDEAKRRQVTEAKESLTRYAGEFPERVNDERHADYVSWVFRAVDKMLKVLDDYDITAKK